MSYPTQRIEADEKLLKEALHLLEYATYHDNRYGQMTTEKWQDAAIDLEKRLCERLKVERYATLKAGGK